MLELDRLRNYYMFNDQSTGYAYHLTDQKPVRAVHDVQPAVVHDDNTIEFPGIDETDAIIFTKLNHDVRGQLFTESARLQAVIKALKPKYDRQDELLPWDPADGQLERVVVSFQSLSAEIIASLQKLHDCKSFFPFPLKVYMI